MAFVYTHPTTAANLPCLPGSPVISDSVPTSFVPPVHNQGAGTAPSQGLALWKIFLPATGSFFVTFDLLTLPAVEARFPVDVFLPLCALSRFLFPACHLLGPAPVVFSFCNCSYNHVFSFSSASYAVITSAGLRMSPSIFAPS